MNSTTAYIVVCMLLLSALISLIILLLTVTERPDLLPAEPPPRRFLDISAAFGLENESTVVGANVGSVDSVTVIPDGQSLFMVSRQIVNKINDTVHDKTTNFLNKIMSTVVPTIMVNDVIDDIYLTTKASTTVIKAQMSQITTANDNLAENALKTVTMTTVATRKEVENSDQTEMMTTALFPPTTVAIFKENLTSTIQTAANSDDEAIPKSFRSTVEEMTHFVIGSRIEQPIVDQNSAEILPIFIENPLKNDTVNRSEVTPPSPDYIVIERLDAATTPTPPTVGDILAALALGAATKPLRPARPTARIIDAVIGQVGRAEQIQIDSFESDTVARVAMREIFRNWPTVADSAADNDTVALSTVAPKSSKFLAVLADATLLYLPRSDGKITVSCWDDSARVLTVVETLKTPLKRVHRMKLLHDSSQPTRFVAIDGDRPKRVVLLNLHGDFLPTTIDVEIPSAVGAKDICVDGERIFVLSRQALNGSSTLFVYDTSLRLQRRVALQTPFGENCNFVEARAHFVYVSCQSAVLRIDTQNDATSPKKFGASYSSYALAILPLASNRLLAAQRGRAELHLFNESTGRLASRLIDISKISGPVTGGGAFFTSLATMASGQLTNIFAVEHITGAVHVYRTEEPLL